MSQKIVAFLLTQLLLTFAEDSYCPKMGCDSDEYQDGSRCFPDVGEWYQIYRNYYYDPDFGGASECVKFYTVGAYENFSTQITFSYGTTGIESVTGRYVMTSTPGCTGKNLFTFVPDEVPGAVQQEQWSVIYTDCYTCFIARHRYADNGYGCTYWRRVSTFHKQAEYCELMYENNCGSSSKYQVYYESCPPELGMPGA